jgi:hypothetical protein
MDAREETGAAGRGRVLARKPAGRGGRAATSPHLNDMLEYLRWVNVMVHDHDLLRRLLARLRQADSPRERAYLLGVALDLHRVHQEFEAAWMRLPELEPRRGRLENLAARLEAEPTATPAWSALLGEWCAGVEILMRCEELCFDRQEDTRQPPAAWSTELLEGRVAAIAEVNAALAMRTLHGHA